jgi:hypothetical protein
MVASSVSFMPERIGIPIDKGLDFFNVNFAIIQNGNSWLLISIPSLEFLFFGDLIYDTASITNFIELNGRLITGWDPLFSGDP